MQTLTHACRSLRRAPAFALAAALTLSIGIGATTAIFAVLNTILLKPLPYREPSQLAGIWFNLPGMSFPRAPQSASSYFTFRRFSRQIEGIGVVSPNSVNLEVDGGAAERVRSANVSASVFPLLGVPLQLGRSFTADEDAPHAQGVAVLSDGLWRRRFGGDRAVIGKTVRINGVPSTIVGVASPTFQFPNAVTQLWTPIAFDSTSRYGGIFGFQSFVRLKPGATNESLARELNQLLPRIGELYPDVGPGMPTSGFLKDTHASIYVHSMRDDVVGTFGNVLWIAVAAGVCLLLISFANVASLLLTRAEGRQRELAVRVVLGAGPRRIISQYLSESLVLAAIGGVFGLLLAFAGVKMFVHSGPPGVPRLAEMSVDLFVVAFAIGLTLVMALLCCIVPAIRYDVRQLAARLRDGTRGGTTGRDRQRARRTLVVTQVAFATVLVAGAGLLFRSMDALRHVQPGFDAEHTLTMWLAMPTASYRGDSDIVRTTTQIVDRVAALPGVAAAGLSSKIPLNGIGINFTPVYSDADDPSSKKLPPSAEVITTSGTYFNAMGIPLIAGRTFDRPERQHPREAIIDRSMAFQRWHDSTGVKAIGRRIYFTPNQPLTVIGVVGAVHDTSIAAPANSLVYVPHVPDDSLNSFVARTNAVVVRTKGDPHALVVAVQRAISEVDHSLPPFGIAVMSDNVEQSMTRLDFVMTLIGVTATIALVLAAIGLYGVLAYMVSLRARELSVRLAIGAMPSRVAWLVTGQGATLAIAGVVVGIATFLGTSRFLRSLLNGVSSPDALTVIAVASVLMMIAIAASWIPARRASRIDPARALSGD
ncbi:MAG TPA: ABC transporter permease [Gemmatimonadaceae bacterium]